MRDGRLQFEFADRLWADLGDMQNDFVASFKILRAAEQKLANDVCDRQRQQIGFMD